MIVAGLWMNNLGGPRPYAVSQFHSVDGSARETADGAWNWGGSTWNYDPADRDNINDPSR